MALAVALLAIRHMVGCGPRAVPSKGGVGRWRGMLVALDMAAADGSSVLVVDPYWFHLVYKLTLSVVMDSR